MNHNPSLRRAARLWGLQLSYVDAFGRVQHSSEDSLRRMLKSLGGGSEDEFWRLNTSIPLAPVHSIWDGHWRQLNLWLPIERVRDEFELQIQLEDGSTRELSTRKWRREIRKLRKVNSRQWSRVRFQFDEKLPLGYHHLKFEGHESLLIAAPTHLPTPDWVEQKNWGLFTPTYALRSDDDFGIGSLCELKEVARAVHKRGGRWVGTLPMLASDWGGENVDPSPYNSLSRLFWNENYLDLHEVLREFPIEHAIPDARKLEALRAKELVDYARAHQTIESVLSACCERHFEHVRRSTDFQAFLKNNPLVQEYAEWRARGDESKRHYHLFTQYLMARQLTKIKVDAEHGASARLYLDYPVGVSRDGFDCQKFKSCFLPDTAAGAPPDRLFVGGQNWGFQPLHPIQLRLTKYDYLIQSLRSHFRHCDLLRIDHVMGMQRIFSIPDGLSAQDGVYMRYVLDEWMAVLCLEASRAKALVIGEDLGTVSPVIRKHMNDHDLKRLWVFQFTMGSGPERAFAEIQDNALVSFNTHDLVPFAGFWRLKDLDYLRECGLLKPEREAEMKADRLKLIDDWSRYFRSQNLELDSQELHDWLLKKIFASNARFISINAEDLWSEEKPQNIPGTHREYPNWCRRFPLKPDLSLDAHLHKVIAPV